MTLEEAKTVFLNRGYVEVEGGTIYDPDKWREACRVISEWLEQEPCGDAISRQAAIIQLSHNKNGYDDCDVIVQKDIETIKDLPPVTPQQKTGHWIQTNEFFINQEGQFIYKFICSECKSLSYFRKSNKKAIGANVCPNCGAKMVESQERSEE